MARHQSKSLSVPIAQLAILLVAGIAAVPALRGVLFVAVVTLLCILTLAITVALIARSGQNACSPMAVDRSNVFSARSNVLPKPAAQSSRPTSFPVPTTPPSPGKPIDRVRGLDWYQFEKLTAALFTECGFEVQRFGGANADGGIDLIVKFDGKTYGVQCKHWKAWKVGVKEMREFVGALKDRGFDRGIFVTLHSYTPDAKALANRHQIDLADADEITRMLATARCDQNPRLLAILEDPRKLCPKCEAEMVLRTIKNGSNVGSQFWGCPKYPRCHGRINIEAKPL